MAGIVERFKKKNRSDSPRDWNSSGSFMNKPQRGWLHPDDQLNADAGVVYGVRYIGCMEVKQSMKSLDFETRTAVAKESISRVCDAAGLKTATKKNKRSTKVAKLLGDNPNLVFAGSNVNLTITTDSLTIMNMENGELIGNHVMPGISFASGGDPDTMDFVAYVAKDEMFGRACHVLECGGGLAQDVITTIGQAFELRFKLYLANRPEAVALPDRLENPVFGSNGDAWGEDEEKDYYNDRAGAQPPSPPHYATPPCNLPVSDGVYNSIKNPERKPTDSFMGFENNFVYDNKAEGATGDMAVYDNPDPAARVVAGAYDNGGGASPTIAVLPQNALFDDVIYDNKDEQEGSSGVGLESPDVRERDSRAPPLLPPSVYDVPKPMAADIAPPPAMPPPPPPQQKRPSSPKQNGHVSPKANGVSKDAFDMSPFCQSLPADAKPPSEADLSRLQDQHSSHSSSSSVNTPPHNEPWFHGRVSRQLVENILLCDGDFLVRESANSPGQYVLSGKRGGKVKHLLLVDPEGVVRTKDRTFDSISHLVKYHMDTKQPITSNDSELLLKKPIPYSSG